MTGILAWLGLAAPPNPVTVATHEWLAADADARAEVSAREQLAAAQCREAAARYELRQRNRMYGRASATIGRLRAELAREREVRAILDRAFIAKLNPVDEQRGADETLAGAMQRHPSGTADPADTAQVGDADPTNGEHVTGDCTSAGSGWWCTRDAGHAGQHLAGTGDTVAAVWPNEPDADAVLVAKAEHLGDEIGPGREAAIEGAAITLAAHRFTVGTLPIACSCGWRGESVDHTRHVAEQLAAVGALSVAPAHEVECPSCTATIRARMADAAAPAPLDLIDGGDYRWRWVPAGYSRAVERPKTREEVDLNWGPIREVEPEEVPF